MMGSWLMESVNLVQKASIQGIVNVCHALLLVRVVKISLFAMSVLKISLKILISAMLTALITNTPTEKTVKSAKMVAQSAIARYKGNVQYVWPDCIRKEDNVCLPVPKA